MRGFELVSHEELVTVTGRGSKSKAASAPSIPSPTSNPSTTTYLAAPYDTKKGSVQVTSYTPGQGGTFYSVAATTKAEITKTIPTYKGDPYAVEPLPRGTYNVSTTAQSDVGGYGPGYKVDVGVSTMVQNQGAVVMSDY